MRLFKSAIVWSAKAIAGIRLVRSADYDRMQSTPSVQDRAELIRLRNKSEQDDRTFARLQDIVNEYAYGVRRTPQSAELMRRISQEWQAAKKERQA